MQRGVGGPQLRARLAAAPSALAPAPCPACPVLAPSGGLRRGEQGGAHGQPPPQAGVRCRLPAPPAGPLAGRSWAVAAAPAAPLSGQRPHGGARPAIPPSAALGPFLGAVLRRPRLRRVGALACSAPCLSAAWSFFPRRFLPQPSPLPPPVPLPLRGRGKRKRLTPAAAGTGGARLPQRAKKPPRLWLLPPAKRHKTRILFKNTGPTKRPHPFGAVPFFRPWFLSGPRPDVPSGCARKSRPSIAASRVFSALGLRRCGPTK